MLAHGAALCGSEATRGASVGAEAVATAGGDGALAASLACSTLRAERGGFEGAGLVAQGAALCGDEATGDASVGVGAVAAAGDGGALTASLVSLALTSFLAAHSFALCAVFRDAFRCSSASATRALSRASS